MMVMYFRESPQPKAVFNTDSDSVAKPQPDNLDVGLAIL